MRNSWIAGAAVSTVLLLGACSGKDEASFAYEPVKNTEVSHIHGMGYINGDDDLVIASHAGLYAYGADGWTETNQMKNDYMGFQAVDDGFFASGHPAVNSDMKNPFGLMKSTDKGATFDQLAFYGEIDFHYLGAGYGSNAVYVYNETPVPGLPGGLNYTLDEGETWSAAAMEGFEASTLSNVAVHPTRPETVALGSQEGLFISEDAGDTFTRLGDMDGVTYVVLTEDGGFFAAMDSDERPSLWKFENGGGTVTGVPLGPEIRTPIQFIAVSPESTETLDVATFDNSIYRLKGAAWEPIAEDGTLLES
ncbi:F510_1955 family glycosylhydrolase [Sporosarcina koreensis]|uniref:F510_1955 family glycosylhydrolase n=1 Tax=Sporosarcina koreensis TaxID=334735 RepID=UPI001181A644|nr:sialidase [Sporosarcina koreensis]